MWEEADELSMYSQTCIGTKSASSKRRIFSSSLLITQNSSCGTSQLLHSKPSLPASQQLPKSFYLHVQFLVSLTANEGNMNMTSALTAACRADPQSCEGVPIPRNEDLYPPPALIPDFRWPGSSGKLMGSFSSPPSPSLIQRIAFFMSFHISNVSFYPSIAMY